MAAPTGVADSYATQMNTTLTVPALIGVLANDGGVPTSATYVVGSQSHGVVALASDGSFTFYPAANYIGSATFRYVAHNADGASAETTVTITVGDCVAWAHLRSGAEGQSAVEGEGRGKTMWRAMADKRNRTPAEILASLKLPQRGDPLRRFKLTAGAYAITRSYTTDGDAVSVNIVVVLVEAKQEDDNPWLWTVAVSYEGKEDPTAELPEVQSGETEYQDYKTTDIHGRAITNSALDPFLGGMPVDDAIDSLTITRNLPFEAWNTEIKRGYRHTLNLHPFTLGNQVDGNGNPIILPPGVVRLKRITEQRMVRAKAATVAAAKFYWRVTVELVMDQRTYRAFDVTTGAAVDIPVKHRWTVADAGFNTISAATKFPITFVGGSRPTEPQLLDGKGALLVNPKDSWPPATAPGDAPDVCAATNKAYAYPAGALTVAAPGLLADCYSTTGNTADLTAHLVTNVTAAMGTLTLNPDGSFTFTREATPFSGYAWFTYRVKAGGVDITYSAPMTVVIFCGVTPVLLAFERYKYADWTPLAALLEGW